MPHKKSTLANILGNLDFGASVAELDGLLQSSRVETSVFSDLLQDKVDLVPGTKGSGKSALYRIFVDFLPGIMLRQRKVVVAHGVQAQGDQVFHVFKDRFEQLSEDDFKNFWCIYLISLANEHFLKGDNYVQLIADRKEEIERFRAACQVAGIPEIQAKKSLRDVLAWILEVMPRPRISYDVKKEKIELDLFERAGAPIPEKAPEQLPLYVGGIKECLEDILVKADLNLWLMVDRLDEIFPRRSALETRALRGLLHALQVFQSPRIRLKVFLRDDILEQITSTPEGFTGLTHITARQADGLRWSEEQILQLIVNRLSVAKPLCKYLNIDTQRLLASHKYREQFFYQIFPRTVHTGPNQSPTLRWIYNHTMDGRGAVTPRDVIDLLTKARQWQLDDCKADADGITDSVIGSPALRYGLAELSKRKRDTYLKAEFPHFWKYMEKFIKGKTEYTEDALFDLLGEQNKGLLKDLLSIGFIREGEKKGERTYKIPFLYRAALELTQGLSE